MSDDDPFADLGETLADDAGGPEGVDAASDATEPPADDSTDPEQPSDDAEPTADSEDETGASADPTTDAAFSYHDADQRPFYARPATIDAFDSWLNYELERDLHDRGYQNIVVREMTDALLRTVVEEDLLDEVAERFERARGEAASD